MNATNKKIAESCYDSTVNNEVLCDMESVSAKIKALRTELHLTQKELADKVGVHPTQLAKYELGLSTPSLGVLIKLAKYCEVSIDYIVFGADKELAKSAKIKDKDILELLRRIDGLKRPQRDRLKWAIQGLLNNKEPS